MPDRRMPSQHPAAGDEPDDALEITPLDRSARPARHAPWRQRLTPRTELARVAGIGVAMLLGLAVVLASAGLPQTLLARLRAPGAQTSPGGANGSIQRVATIGTPPALTAGVWQRVALPVPTADVRAVAVSRLVPDTAYVCATTSDFSPIGPLPGIVLWRTTDDGAHWEAISPSSLVGAGCQIALAADESDLIGLLVAPAQGCGQPLFVLSHDDGQLWSARGLPPPPFGSLSCQQRVWLFASRMFYELERTSEASPGAPFTSSAELLRSDDDGRSWQSATGGLPALAAANPTIATDGQSLVLPVARTGTATTDLWISANAGKSWQPALRVAGFAAEHLLMMWPGDPLLPLGTGAIVYGVAGEGVPSSLPRTRAALLTSDQAQLGWRAVPPLPVPGATAARSGILQPLTLTPGGSLLALGGSPRGVTASPASSPASTQWLWIWSPVTGAWSLAAPGLAVPWPPCAAGCAQGWVVSQAARGGALELWLSVADEGLFVLPLAPSIG